MSPDQTKINDLSKALKRSNTVCTLSIAALCLITLSGFVANPVQDSIRAKQIIVEDESGQARIIIAAPIPDELVGITRQQATSGIVLLNADGDEQFGVGTTPDGSIVMGLDSVRGVGNDRNPERITLSVNKNGSPQIRLLDNHTRVTTSLWSNEEGGQISFYDWTPFEDGKTEFVGFMAYGKESGYTHNK